MTEVRRASLSRMAGLAAAALLVPLAISGCVQNSAKHLNQAAPTATNEPGWIVGMGDSYMSGEAGRWATNTPEMTSNTGYEVGTAAQVYGETAAGTSSIYAGCHRADSAPMVFSESTLQSTNLACSGAKSATVAADPDTKEFKPGIDFAEVKTESGKTGSGQAAVLQDFASKNRVEAITLSIGGNNAGFATVLVNCVEDYLVYVYCHKQESQLERVTKKAQAELVSELTIALNNIQQAMSKAGYNAGDYRVIYQLPPEPVANGKDMIWGETYARASKGGCGVYNADIAWLKDDYTKVIKDAMVEAAQAVSTNSGMRISTVDNRSLFNKHLLCQDGTTRMDGTGKVGLLPPPDTRDTTEWVRAISIADQLYRDDADAKTEAMHPMYWGQRALANCNEAAVNAGSTAETFAQYTCTLTGSYNSAGQPEVALVPLTS